MFIPRIEGDRNFCDYPCEEDQFLFWDGYCSPDCEYPLVQKTISAESFCEFPCDTTTYLYYNRSCLPNCTDPYISADVGEYKYCNPSCTGEEMMLMNGSCITTCDAPFRIIPNQNAVSSCFPPCENPLDYLDEVTEECISECETEWIQINETDNGTHYPYLFCKKPNITVIDYNPVVLVKLLHHIKYLNETLPAYALPTKLKNLFVSRGNNMLTLRVHSQMLDEPRNDFTRLLASASDKAASALGLHRMTYYASFIGNFIDDLILLAIILSCEIILAIIEWIAARCKMQLTKDIANKLRVLTHWNLPLSLLCVNIGDIIFFANREFRTYDSDSPRSTISLITCIIMLIVVAVLYIGTIRIIRGIKKAQAKSIETKSNSELITYLMKWKSFQVLFGGCTISYPVLRHFYLLYATRLALPMIFAAFLESVPLLQVVLYVAISITMIIYVIYRKPIQNKIDYINIWVLEGLIFGANISALALVGMYYAGNHNEKAKDVLGEIIIVCSYIIDYVAIIFFITKVVSTVRLAIMYRKEQSKEEKGVWLQLLFLPFQQGGMGFEQVRVLAAAENSPRKIHPSSKMPQDRWERAEFGAPSTRIYPAAKGKLKLDQSQSQSALVLDSTTNAGSPSPLKGKSRFNFVKESLNTFNVKDEASPDTSKVSPMEAASQLELNQSGLLNHSERKLLKTARKEDLPSPRVINLKPSSTLEQIDLADNTLKENNQDALEGLVGSANHSPRESQRLVTPENNDKSPLERARLRRGLKPKKKEDEAESVFALSESVKSVKTNSRFLKSKEKSVDEKKPDTANDLF